MTTTVPSSLRSALGRPARRRSPISLTPLIDVVFILLIFFMLASSFLDWRTISLSGAVAGASAMEGSFLVEVRPEGLRFAGQSVALPALAQRLARGQADAPERPVLVKPHPDVSLQRAVDVIDGLSRAGIANLSLIRDR